jgi:NtrC-family two-component system response regulator AlgB
MSTSPFLQSPSRRFSAGPRLVFLSVADSLSILVVDDEPSIRKSLALCLELDGHQVRCASRVEEAREAVRRTPFDLAFVDLRLGTQSGLDLLPELLVAQPGLRIVVITAFATVDTAVEAMRRGAFDYLPKPFEPSQVAAVAAKVAALHEPKAGSEDGLLFDSSCLAVREALALARQVARKGATVLLRGESGTGKTVLARAIHRWSTRSDAPFSTLSCPSLSAELLASELFGHVKGAFTGAVSDAPGRIAACEGGTLFLDEVGDLPREIQPRLLRFLQDREYERVGDPQTRHSDVRILAATHVDLEAAVREGRFREDLFYRLNVVQITLPPLRERREDIPALARTALERVCRGGEKMELSPDSVELLQTLDWPGNLRELSNAVERAAVLSIGPRIGPELFASASRSTAPRPSGDLLPLEALEEMHVRRVLASTRTLDEAARVLGIDAATLWRKRKRYGI